MKKDNDDTWDAWGSRHEPNDFGDSYGYDSSRPDNIYSNREYRVSESRMNNGYTYGDDYDDSNNRRRSDKNTPTRSGKRRKKKARRHRVLTTLIVLVAICAIIGGGMVIGMYTAVKSEIKDMNLQTIALNQNSVIYYKNSDGKYVEYEQLQSSSGNSIYTENIPQHVKDALVSIEDERFYSHHGVDFKRTIGATIQYALSKVGIGSSSYGGSTITQQVIKNITQEKSKTPTRKIKEMLRAYALENELTKDEILTMYLNIVYFSQGCYGIEAAAQTYFGKSTEDLSIAEAASLVGIVQTPTKYDPIKNPENNIQKRNTVLAKMLELGKITQAEYDKAIATPLELNTSSSSTQTKVSSYFVDMVIRDIIIDLQDKKGYTESFATQKVYNGGLKIYTTLDLDIQEAMEEIYENTSNFPDSSAQSAMIIIDPYTGEIKGVVGGIGEKTTVRGLNRAVQSKRQPGSAIKPLSVYAPALEKGSYKETDSSPDTGAENGDAFTEATILNDEKRTFITETKEEWTPSNSYSSAYGNITAKTALEISSNVAAASVLEDYLQGHDTSFKYLQNNFHITTLEDGDNSWSPMALGGLTYGVTVKEIAAAYCVFANGGKYIAPYSYTSVVDTSDDEPILENKSTSSQVIDPSTAYIISDMLYEVVNGTDSHATGRNAKVSGQKTYGKTGTTNDDYDRWFVGYTPYYVAATWYGYDENKAISASSNPSVTIWQKVMTLIHKDLSGTKEIEKPTNVIEMEICTDTGLKARSGCPSETFYFKDGTEPEGSCSKHGGSSSLQKATAAPSSSSADPSAANGISTPKPMSSSDTEIPTPTPRPAMVPNGGNGNPTGSSTDTSSGSDASSGGISSSDDNSGGSSGDVGTPIPSKSG